MSRQEDDRERIELAREKRRRKHLDRLGFPNPKCFFCGEEDVRCLHLDHIEGQEFTDNVWPICANDHARRTDLQKDHPLKAADPSDILEIVGRFLHGRADYQEMSVTKLREYGSILCAEAAARSPRLKRDGDKHDGNGGPSGCPT
jgi:hypothetical protein